ncbi:zinc finger CCCH domain-containing protein 13 isoform X2 [Lotus japonicus]|uniref:zinc finger CCCH domain-containing protein 13 isoform X2 n=1 Tax=Lotus japonicus TaxID=34305 RepID=UPI00258AA502|nr:zinc finger CCCH domain-containing protein 13 isoform X2 [Lotus japonicus]
MVERKQFKTRLCVLYQRGRCNRHNCSFAHGNAELRRFSSSYSGRRDYSSNDLRDKLDRRHLSPRRYSPARDARGRQAIHEYSPPRSLEKKSSSDRKHRRKQGITSQSDNAGSLKVSDRVQDHVKELKKVHSDINTLENQKFQLTVYIDESVQEVDSLNSRIQELKAQLCNENEEYKRISSRIRKFVKVHNHNVQLQDELKRSQIRLERFGDQLVSDISRIGANEEDLSVDIVSNGDNTGLPPIIKNNLNQNDTSPFKKRLHVERDAVVEELKQDRSKLGPLVETVRSSKRSRWNVPSHLDGKGYEDLEAPNNGTEYTRPLDLEGKHKKGIRNPSDNLHSEKLKESRIEVPSTSIAAHIFDEEVEIELDDRTDINETSNTQYQNGVAFGVKGVPLMLPPSLVPHSNYSQYEGIDQNVDVDGLDDEAGKGT